MSNCLNIQRFTGVFISVALAQIIAYSNILLIFCGILIMLKSKGGDFSITARLWFMFYALYYTFGLLANGVSGFQNSEYSLMATLVPVIFFTGYYFFLSNDEYFIIFTKVITFSFVVSSFLTILLYKSNFDFDHGGIYNHSLDRAGGVYADANNASLSGILAFIFFDKYFTSKKIFKTIILLIIFYSILITLSTTGLFVFVIVFILTKHKFFSGLRIILFGAILTVFYFFLFRIEQFYGYFNLSEIQINKINNIKNVLTFQTEKINSSGRSELVEELLYYVYQKPFLGNGIGFSTFIRGHNTYIGVWGDAGLFTFLFFILLLIIYLLKSFKLEINLRFFCFSILATLYIFMLTLQTVINQGYIIVVFAFVGYVLDKNKQHEYKNRYALSSS
ncbi:hypothetical protein BKM32_10660 [Mangrovimonas sp. DI 80]|nr:hypothetical protein BKM32_10660 [Mangrovimonas sp. DI 80]